MSKRINGEGTIRQRSSGIWEARLAYTDDDGVSDRQSFYGKTRAEAKRKLDEARRRLEAGDPARDAALTVGEWCDQWMATTLAASSRKPSTKQTFRVILNSYVKPTKLGRTALPGLRPSVVDAWLMELRAMTKKRKGDDGEVVWVRRLSETSMVKVFRCLSVALDGAVRDKRLARNPLASAEVPKVERREARYLTAAQTLAILAAAKQASAERRGHGDVSSASYPLLALIAAMGMRKGEALALKWADVDLKDATITIRGTLTRIDGELVVTAPKTARSRRMLTVSPGVVELLKSWRRKRAALQLRAGSEWVESDYVFTTEAGRPVDPSSALRVFKVAAARAGVEGATIHSLRHAAATAMINAGNPITAVSSALGHARTSITVDVYGHAGAEAQAAALADSAAAIGL